MFGSDLHISAGVKLCRCQLLSGLNKNRILQKLFFCFFPPLATIDFRVLYWGFVRLDQHKAEKSLSLYHFGFILFLNKWTITYRGYNNKCRSTFDWDILTWICFHFNQSLLFQSLFFCNGFCFLKLSITHYKTWICHFPAVYLYILPSDSPSPDIFVRFPGFPPVYY